MSGFMVKRKLVKRTTRKGQAVMEYLVTYGLALLVILLVLGILFAVVFPMLKAPSDCKFSDPTFSCDQKPQALVADSSNNVRILFQLDNTGGSAVQVIDVLCTTKSPGNLKMSDFKNVLASVSSDKLTLSSSQSMTFGGTSSTADVTTPIDCYKDDGTKVVLQPNSQFHGTLAVEYKNTEEVPGAPPRIATAVVTGAVQAGS
jgi:hypothetical protein